MLSRSTVLLFVAGALFVGCPTRNPTDTGGTGMDVPGTDSPVACTTGPENTAVACADGCSNDGDAFVDCDDFDCDAFCADGGTPLDTPPAPACDGGTMPEDNAVACADGCSNDGDPFADCNDFDCCDVVTCGPGTVCGMRSPEDTAGACADRTDNDDDGFTDCDDFDCEPFCVDGGMAGGACDAAMSAENTAVACADGCSNDGDRFVDCDDFDCDAFCGTDAGPPAGGCDGGMTAENTPAACSDGCSNDGDRFADCDDFDCCSVVSCTTGACSRDAGPPRDAGPVTPENTDALCRDGMSNDGDRFIDCEDRDCCAVRRDCGATTYCGMRDAG
jgi:hypothetical protein